MYSTQRRTPVLCGNAYVDGAGQRGWFIGHFLEHAHDLRSTHAVEVKWSTHQAGEEKRLWSMNEHATTLCMLVKGNVRIRFPSEECILSHEGDYVIWPAGVPHRWMVTEDSLILTMRWPSTSGDCKEIGEAEATGRDEVERERED
jgi:quercetin dioxygenase-like cupin family protein